MKPSSTSIYPDEAPIGAENPATSPSEDGGSPAVAHESRAARFIRGTCVTLFFAVLTFVFTRPVSLDPARRAFDTCDPLLDSWSLAWVTKTLFTHPTQLFDGNVFYPYNSTLAYTEHFVGMIPVAAPVIWLTGNPLLAHNIALMVSFVLSGVGTYLLVRRLTGYTGAAVMAGMVFSFASFKIAHLTHLQVLSAQWMPLTMFFLHRAMSLRRWRDFVGFAACFTMQVLSCLYYALFFGCAVALFVVFVVAFRRRLITPGVIGKFVTVSALSGLILLPFLLPYFRLQKEFDFTYNIANTQKYSAAVEDYAAASAGNFIYGNLTAPLRKPEGCEHILFSGALPAGLALVALIGLLPIARNPRGDAAARSRFELAFYALLGLFAFLMSLGPVLQMLGKTYDIPMPYRLFFYAVPGAKGIRVPSRFGVLAILSLAVLAGFGLAQISNWLTRRFGTSKWLTNLLAVFVIAVVYCELYAVSGYRRIDLPPDMAVCRWLATQDRDTVIAEIPAQPIVVNARYQYFSTLHWLRIVNGNSSFLPPQYDETMRKLDRLPDVASVDFLRALDIRLLVFHPDLYADQKLAGATRQRLDASPEMQLVQSFDHGERVYRVLGPKNPPATPTTSTSSQYFNPILPRVIQARDSFFVPIRAELPSDIGAIVRGNRKVTGIASWDAGLTQSVNSHIPAYVLPESSDDVGISVDAPAAPGHHMLNLRLNGPSGAIQVGRGVEVVDTIPDSLQKSGHRATITLDASALANGIRVKAGQRVRVDCVVRNDGETLWLANSEKDGRGWVGVRLRDWRDLEGREVLDPKGKPFPGRAMLTHPLWPGQSLKIRMYAVPPAIPGTYMAKIDLCSEWIFWFGDEKASTSPQLRVTVE